MGLEATIQHLPLGHEIGVRATSSSSMPDTVQSQLPITEVLSGASLRHNQRQTFDYIPRWLEELRSHADKNIFIILAGNKCDLEDQRVVLAEDAQEFAQREDLFFLETSALNATNVESAFLNVLSEIKELCLHKMHKNLQEKIKQMGILRRLQERRSLSLGQHKKSLPRARCAVVHNSSLFSF
ncbi:GTP-binding protein [Nymphaea thermarum]|nr:GTP-binding protein [Nymphaea thermarum]